MTFLSSTRLLVIASAAVATFAEAWQATTYTPEVFWLGIAGFGLLVTAGERLRSIALPIVMAALYLTPAILLTALGDRGRGYGLDAIWILPLLGLTLSGRGVLKWSLPGPWRLPLIIGAVIAAIAWPIVFLREVNFALWILPLARVSNTSIGIPPSEVVLNVAYFAVIHLVGILWIDALCRWYGKDAARFRREVPGGLLIAAALAAVVSIYQGFVDLGFLNGGFWEYMIRASGTLADPNKLGAVAAFWTVGAIVFARRMSRPWPIVVAIAGLVLGVAAVWLSGSRTGLAAVTISVLVAAIEAVRCSKLGATKLAVSAAAALALALVVAFVLQNAATHTIWQRGAIRCVPFVGDGGIRNCVNEYLWDRYGYGPVAIQMIKEHPIEGVGVGLYHALSHDFGIAAGRIIPQPDNAQAWWRHNLAELGVIGFIPLLWWCVVFGRQMFAIARSADRLSAAMLRGVLIGFFVASLFGMPSQSVAIVMTFWVFVFWLSLEATPVAADPSPRRQPSHLMVIAAALIAIHAGMTIVDAFGDLRPHNRAQRWDWYYRYGFHTNDNDGTDLEPDPGGNPIGRRWTMTDSLAVIKVKGKVLKFVAWIDHPDSDVNPVHTRIWADSKLVYEGDLKRSPIFLDIPATPGRTHLLLETSIDRTWRPSDAGSRDGRALGLSIRDWVWE
jgi:O-antigen ligase